MKLIKYNLATRITRLPDLSMVNELTYILEVQHKILWNVWIPIMADKSIEPLKKEAKRLEAKRQWKN